MSKVTYSVGAFTAEGNPLGEFNLTQGQAQQLARVYAGWGNSAEVFGWVDGEDQPVSREAFYACDYV